MEKLLLLFLSYAVFSEQSIINLSVETAYASPFICLSLDQDGRITESLEQPLFWAFRSLLLFAEHVPTTGRPYRYRVLIPHASSSAIKQSVAGKKQLSTFLCNKLQLV